MTTNALSDRPEDPDDEFDNDFDDTFFDGFDDESDDDLDDDLDDDELAIDFVIERQTARVVHVFTRGLWELGLPELCVTPPDDLEIRIDRETGSVAILFALGLIELGTELIAVDHFDVPLYHGQLNGTQLQLWLAKQEPVSSRLALALGDEVDTIFRVDCSLWQPAPPANSRSR